MKGMSIVNTPTRIRRAPRAAALVLAVGLFGIGAVACGSDKTSSSADTTGSTAAPTTPVAAGAPVITGQWARTSPADAANGAAYFTITSPIDDTLTGATVDASVAGMSQMHETVMAGTGNTTMGTDTTVAGSGEMTMQPVASIDLKAGQALAFEPGGYHVMMMGLVNPLKVGDTIVLTLTLKNAGQIKVDVPVLDEAP
jgi:copper(I)-binding protein